MTILRRAPFYLRTSTTSLYHTTPSSSAKVTLGIRREDPLRIWERRCPLTPETVHELVEKDGVEVLVQDCDRRVWPTSEFVKAGAKVHPTLSPAHIILGIKETPLNEVLNDTVSAPTDSGHTSPVPRTHLMFSHTIKGQLYNMELLSKFVASPCAQAESHTRQRSPLPRLIDYELLTGENGKRTVGFGWFAGVAGALESLNALAHAHLELGVASPFLYTPRPHTHPTLPSIRALLREEVGARIKSEGTPKSLGPIVFGVTGTGNVAEGVLDLLADLPIEKVKVKDLSALVSDPATDLRKIYVVHALPEDYFVQHDGSPYTRSDYYANPSKYNSEFHIKIAPYLSLLLHGAGWAPSFPRLMTNEQLTIALEKAQQIGRGRFTCVGDISCDIEGGLEFLPRSSTLSAPFFSHRPSTLPAHLPSVTLMAVDILPTALPLEASQHFSRVLLPYLRTLITQYRASNKMDVSDEEARRAEALNRATVAQNGTLTEDFKWLEKPLGLWRANESAARPPISQSSSVGVSDAVQNAKLENFTLKSKKVLMLGSGMVASPAIEEICKRGDIELVVASNSLSEAEEKTKLLPNATALSVDMSDLDKVEALVQEADVVISLLPAPLHPSVAKLCIEHHKHMVTTSYISRDMRALHEEAMSADVLLLNEIGLDPGIDHCSAIALLDKLRAEGNEILAFTSFCGGLPAPECAEDVPLGYKFSWSPKGVLTAALNEARFKIYGRDYHIDGNRLLQSHIPHVPISKIIRFEGLANRDSLPYREVYDLGSSDEIRTIFRGTLRYPGFSQLMSCFIKIGLLDTASPVYLDSWTSLARMSLEQRMGKRIMDDDASVRSAVQDVVGSAVNEHELHAALQWLSIVPPAPSAIGTGNAEAPLSSPPPLPNRPMPPIDLFATLLAHKLRYRPSERDLVVMHHEIVVRSKSVAGLSPRSEVTHTSSLVSYGTSKASAMSRCVGLPVAFAALQVLDGAVDLRGVHGPTDKTVYQNVLSRLEEVGLGMKENVQRGPGTVEGTLHDHFRQNIAR